MVQSDPRGIHRKFFSCCFLGFFPSREKETFKSLVKKKKKKLFIQMITI